MYTSIIIDAFLAGDRRKKSMNYSGLMAKLKSARFAANRDSLPMRLARSARGLIRAAQTVGRQLDYLVRRNLSGKAVPTKLYLENVNICNADCTFCAYQYDRRPKKKLQEDWFKKAVDEYKRVGGTQIGLSPLLGELFVDKFVLEKLDYIKAQNFSSVHTYTNATLFHRFGVEKILDSGLTEIHISVPPLDKELYEKLYRNENYKNVLQNIRDLLIAFKTVRQKTVENIRIEFRSDRPIEQCQALPDYQEYVAPHLSEQTYVSAMQHYDSWGQVIKQSDLLPGMKIVDLDSLGSKRLPCTRIFRAQVISDGRIRLCGCRIATDAPTDELEIGHIKDSTVMEAYNSPNAQKIITSFARGELLDLCKKCSWYETG